jgi:hypothetical protein
MKIPTTATKQPKHRHIPVLEKNNFYDPGLTTRTPAACPSCSR